MDHGARNRFQRVAGFGAERGGAFESDETKERKNEAEAEAAASHATQLELRPVPVRAVANKNQRDQDQDQRDGDGFDPEHDARGNFHVAPRDPHGEYGHPDGEQRGGSDVAGGVVQQQIPAVVEAADHAGAGGDVGEKEAPGGDRGEPGGSVIEA